MNRSELKLLYMATLSRFHLTPMSAVLSAGSALVVHGIRETTSDLDLDVTDSAFRRILKSNRFPTSEFRGQTIIDVSPELSMHAMEASQRDVRVVDGIGVYSPTALLRQKRALAIHPDRKPEKVQQDLLDIAALEKLTERASRRW